ncbi:peptide-methionine (R)-S-oxide reductase MsrB [Leucobacter sp. CSA1]|uniref:peptide-methionine (R)-S-oxide reductase n=1 Tax=Leucobacter chromiisoli TaxID=2796471 RepID=A0A934Q4Z1_9MICO|nr:peptide-methionine (R)-S-oxide reductase MsrB [Leucobacter chromiisoli]MBK0417713.1 peptide-methionine (R)-S-oxide reductase MsrB [Leucobacter chromiisoli]
MSKPIDADADYEVQLSDSEWRAKLSPEEYAVLRQAGTERAGTGELLHEDRDGLYRCRACGNELFVAGTKFDSGCGWPSFYESVRPEAVEYIEDRSLGMVRTEVRCAACGSHLGHVFPDGFGTPTGNRYCMNSVALAFDEGAAPEDDAPQGAERAAPERTAPERTAPEGDAE